MYHSGTMESSLLFHDRPETAVNDAEFIGDGGHVILVKTPLGRLLKV